jgi:hypothetical protein
MTRSLGWRKNEGTQPSARPVLRRQRASLPLPPLAEPDLRPFNGPIVDQGAAGSCVAFAGGRQLGLFWRAMGLTSEWVFPSPRLSYPLARLQEYKGTKPELIPPLRDTGSYPALYLQAIQAVGFVRWEDYAYPTDAATLRDARLMESLVNAHPPANVMALAYDQKGMEYGVYDADAKGRLDWIRDCLLNRMAPTFGMQVDDNFMNNVGGVVKRVDLARSLGGHDQCIVAIDERDNVVVAGSWGRSFGNKGYVLVSPDVINNEDICSDFQIVKAAPLIEAH